MKTFEAEKKRTQTVLSHKFTARMKSFLSVLTTNFTLFSPHLGSSEVPARQRPSEKRPNGLLKRVPPIN